MFKIIIIFLCFSAFAFGQITVLDSITKQPVSYATISFGNGQGLFADDAGLFVFNNNLYPDIDSLFVSALGYKNLNISKQYLSKQLLMQPQTNELKTVVISAKNKRKFKKETLKPYLDDNYYNCWLPTIASEIAVFFNKTPTQNQQLSQVSFPMALESKDWSKRHRSNSEKKQFSTLFKVKFYENNNGFPGNVLSYETIVFRATEKNGEFYQLDVEKHQIDIPDSGFFVSLQVMGYTDKSGKLLPNKMYKEIKSKNGTVKIPTNFRPLLPFTDKMNSKNTYIKRIFINQNAWLKFDNGNGFQSGLLPKNLFNYGIGVTFKTFENE